MPNRLRGEISAMLDGRSWTLVLTLGALAELEEALGCSDLQGLADHFASGKLSTPDLIRVLGAGLRGAGNEVSDDQVAMMRGVGGAAGFVAIAADLLHVTFGSGDDTQQDDEEQGPSSAPFAQGTLPGEVASGQG